MREMNQRLNRFAEFFGSLDEVNPWIDSALMVVRNQVESNTFKENGSFLSLISFDRLETAIKKLQTTLRMADLTTEKVSYDMLYGTVPNEVSFYGGTSENRLIENEQTIENVLVFLEKLGIHLDLTETNTQGRQNNTETDEREEPQLSQAELSNLVARSSEAPKIAEYDTKLQDLEDQKLSLQIEIEDLESDIKDLQNLPDRIKTLEGKIIEYGKKKAKVEELMAKAEDELNWAERKVELLQNMLERRTPGTSSYVSTQQDIFAWEDKVETSTNDISGYEQEMYLYKDKRDMAMRDRGTLIVEDRTSETLIAEYETTKGQLSADLDSVNQDIAKYSGEKDIVVSGVLGEMNVEVVPRVASSIDYSNMRCVAPSSYSVSRPVATDVHSQCFQPLWGEYQGGVIKAEMTETEMIQEWEEYTKKHQLHKEKHEDTSVLLEIFKKSPYDLTEKDLQYIEYLNQINLQNVPYPNTAFRAAPKWYEPEYLLGKMWYSAEEGKGAIKTEVGGLFHLGNLIETGALLILYHSLPKVFQEAVQQTFGGSHEKIIQLFEKQSLMILQNKWLTPSNVIQEEGARKAEIAAMVTLAGGIVHMGNKAAKVVSLKSLKKSPDVFGAVARKKLILDIHNKTKNIVPEQVYDV